MVYIAQSDALKFSTRQIGEPVFKIWWLYNNLKSNDPTFLYAVCLYRAECFCLQSFAHMDNYNSCFILIKIAYLLESNYI